MLPQLPIKIVTVHLGTGQVKRREISDPELLKKYLGGRGIATHLFLNEYPTDNEPYDAEAPLMFAPGLLTGTVTPCSGRTSVLFKSPATGMFFKTNVGGHFGAQLKFAGYDLLVIQGRADRPVYVYIEDDRISIREAAHLWGKDVRETNRIVREELDDPDVQVACTGPAGENKVAFASIQVSIYNAAGRGGGGALMGDKNLKAVAVRGTKGVSVKKPDAYLDVLARVNRKKDEAPGVQPLSDYGTSIGVDFTNAIGAFPVNNFQQGTIEGVNKLTGTYLVEGGYLKRKIACFSCPVACHRYVTVDQGIHQGTYTGGPEYETLSALGGGCGVTDTDAIIKANELCNILGMDTISVGNSIQWLMECYQRKVVTTEEADGLDMNWGNGETVIRLVEKIAKREGVGDLLADGLRAASGKLGKDSYKWAIQARGLEQSRVETRSAFGYALAFAINSRGPDHLNTECLAEFGGDREAIRVIEKITGDKKYAYPHTTEKRAEIVRWHEDIYGATDSLGICAFVTTAQFWMDDQDLADLFNTATGLEVTAEDIMVSGRRVITMERIYNALQGHTREQDVLPYRLMNEVQHDAMHDHAINSAEMLDGMKDEYFRLHEWDQKTGWPTRKVLERLGMPEVVTLVEGRLDLMEVSEQ
jgi:aldehyde:ferredoxin oxidoreductase